MVNTRLPWLINDLENSTLTILYLLLAVKDNPNLHPISNLIDHHTEGYNRKINIMKRFPNEVFPVNNNREIISLFENLVIIIPE